MLNQIVSNVKDNARATARAAAFSVLGAIFALIGLGFLTVALWLLLQAQEGTLFAATVIGALYCAVGFAFLAFGARGKSKSTQDPLTFQSERTSANAPREPFMQMAEGFAMGMQAGRSARTGNQ